MLSLSPILTEDGVLHLQIFLTNSNDIPYALAENLTELGFADSHPTTVKVRLDLPSGQNTRVDGGPAGRRREGNQAFGSGIASAFAYFYYVVKTTRMHRSRLSRIRQLLLIMALVLRVGGEISEGHLLVMQEALSEAAVEGILSEGPTNEVEVKKEDGETGKRKLILALVPC
jgi:hypothetical protein